MKLSVVVGRFQTDTLHEGHQYLLRKAAELGDALLVVIGEGQLPSTRNNPIPGGVRAAMLTEFLNTLDATVFTCTILKDHPSDFIWSENLDAKIEAVRFHDWLGDEELEVTLYHGRDSFAAHYSGKFKVVGFNDHGEHAATRLRAAIGENPWPSAATVEFRRGMIYANQIQFPTVYGCVDAAVIRQKPGTYWGWMKELLVIRKKGVTGYMLPGGFDDPKAANAKLEAMLKELPGTDEYDALREVWEEAKVVASNPRYVGSFTQNDWRYAPEVDEIRTRLFICDWVEGEPVGSDDAAWAGWIDLDSIKLSDFNSCHHHLISAILDREGLYFIPENVDD